MNTALNTKPLVARLLSPGKTSPARTLVRRRQNPTPGSSANGDSPMKSTLFALCIFCATAAWGQAANYVSSEPQPIQMSGHRLRASQHSMEQEQTLLVNSNNVYGHGERPLW